MNSFRCASMVWMSSNGRRRPIRSFATIEFFSLSVFHHKMFGTWQSHDLNGMNNDDVVVRWNSKGNRNTRIECSSTIFRYENCFPSRISVFRIAREHNCWKCFFLLFHSRRCYRPNLRRIRFVQSAHVGNGAQVDDRLMLKTEKKIKKNANTSLRSY